MKYIVILVSLLAICGLFAATNVQDVQTCWDAKCQSFETACAALPSCVNALKYMNLCEQNQNCNQNATSVWNETCWTFCNYEATPATTDKTWIAFEKCHLANCTNGLDQTFYPKD
jgi:hypothetical protein